MAATNQKPSDKITEAGIVQPALNEKEILGSYAEGSKAASDAKRNYELAKQYLAEANTALLFRLYENAVKENAQIAQAAITFASIKVDSLGRAGLSPTESDSAIQSMERVALAAIELAKMIAERKP